MTKQEMLKEINTMLATMEFLIKKAGLILYISPEAHTLKSEYVKPGYHWLKGIYEKEYAHAAKIRALCKEEVWEMLRLRGERDFIEVRMMNEAFTELRKSVNNSDKPVFFRKNEVERVIKRAHSGHRQDHPRKEDHDARTEPRQND